MASYFVCLAFLIAGHLAGILVGLMFVKGPLKFFLSSGTSGKLLHVLLFEIFFRNVRKLSWSKLIIIRPIGLIMFVY